MFSYPLHVETFGKKNAISDRSVAMVMMTLFVLHQSVVADSCGCVGDCSCSSQQTACFSQLGLKAEHHIRAGQTVLLPHVLIMMSLSDDPFARLYINLFMSNFNDHRYLADVDFFSDIYVASTL